MNEKKWRIWPQPGDLCSLRGSVYLVKEIVHRDGYMTWGTFHDKLSSTNEVCIIVSVHNFSFFNLVGNRKLVFVLTPEVIGWDDYGNYDVETRPALTSLRDPEGHFIRKKRNS